MSNKKASQLGMNPSTASGRLVKDILFKFIQQLGYVCYVCDQELTRDTFSIEHKEPWLDSDDPVGLYFDLTNVAFSHLSCNIKAKKNPGRPKGPCGTFGSYCRGCRCDKCRGHKQAYDKKRRSK